ncbi:MAG: hypothetical protein ACE5I3_06675 [Phycisphaerae bacterium]
MSETTVETHTAGLRAHDGLIESALAELDARLSAWLAAMREGQTAVLSGVSQLVSVAEESRRLARVAADGSDRRPSTATRRGGQLFQGQVPSATATRSQQQTSETPAPPSIDEAALTEDDQALLASLDAETASAIQVKRRLANNQRSVRELLQEIRSEQTAVDDTESQRTRWWRRGNERQEG